MQNQDAAAMVFQIHSFLRKNAILVSVSSIHLLIML